ncbi:hypothetical protein DFS33DRAFT_1456673 [Desarmillaria ectypa]|nr:hypothetical protein DFS33DRAFT_1456673 [Desarmillaria ectypa]
MTAGSAHGSHRSLAVHSRDDAHEKEPESIDLQSASGSAAQDVVLNDDRVIDTNFPTTNMPETTPNQGNIPTASASCQPPTLLSEETKKQYVSDPVLTAPLHLSPRLFADVLQRMKENLHNGLQRAEIVSRATSDVQESSSVPDYAYKMDSAAIAVEDLLRDPIQMFQDVVVNRLVEEGMRAKGAGVLPDDEPSTPSTPAAMECPEPQAVVLSEPLSALSDAMVDIFCNATPCRFRFIDCSQLVHGRTLRVLEYRDLSARSYAAISYVWRGVIGPATASMAKYGSFAVAGAIDGDPISIDVLLHTCRACLLDKIPLIWLDRLGIIQTSREDKAWQIQRMYSVYASCTKCYVLPGGTRRLASIWEPTLWIHRGWTLQEAVAPKECSVVIQWEYSFGTFRNPRKPLGTGGSVEEIVSGESAQIQLYSLLKASVAENVEFRVRSLETWTGRKVDIIIRIFGNDEAGWRRWKNTAFWRSAQMRTSSRPVDMIFSIMGLFGVTLNPKEFEAHDRLGATIALAREILKQGGSPTWLATSLSLPENPSIRSFPGFPETDEAGAAVYEVGSRRLEAAELMRDVDGWLATEEISGAQTDAHGFLTLTMKCAPVKWTGGFQERHPAQSPKQSYDSQLLQFHDLHRPPFVVDNHGKVWRLSEAVERTKFHVALLGRMYTQSTFRFFDPKVLAKAILLEEYQEGKFRRAEGGCWFTFNTMTYRFEGWQKRVFTI